MNMATVFLPKSILGLRLGILEELATTADQCQSDKCRIFITWITFYIKSSGRTPFGHEESLSGKQCLSILKKSILVQDLSLTAH